MNRKYILFDADGVLLDSMQQSCIVFNEIVCEAFPSLPKVYGQTDLANVYAGELRPSLMRFGLSDGQARLFFEMHTTWMVSRANEISAFHEVLREIAESLPGRCAIVSSSRRELIDNVLTRSPGYKKGMFSHISGREMGGTKAERMATILRLSSIETADALYVGDMVSDIIYCRKIGIPVACVGYGYHPAWYLQSFAPDYMFLNTTEIIDFLKSDSSLGSAIC